ncbi:MAG: phenylalanine 4-monooxygenase, partial [Bdellovibrionia bacterium]
MPQRSLTVTEQIPEYLQPYIAHQDPSLYTPIDHASWRFILKISQAFFAKNAHPMYLNGLRETGISTDRIPLISEMDQKLRRFGWRAVPVSGFIPPAVFMEFLSRGVLPIACDMRKIENISYTPAPDIVHEAAGHAPIIAEPSYAAYLRHYGELAEKAIYSKQDLDVYEAVRNLS